MNRKVRMAEYRTLLIYYGIIKIIIMVENTKKTKPAQTEKRPVGRPPKARSNLEKVDEVKLGKFAKQEPLRLPEKQIRRGWQIVWGLALALAAMVGVYLLILIVPEQLAGNGVMSGPAIVASTGWYLLVAELMIVVATVGCIAASVMMFAKKRVPRGLWYVLIGAAVIGVICASFHKFRWYEERRCYENYPGIYPEDPSKGSGCPSVVNQLSVIVMADLAVLLAGVVGMWLVCRAKRGRGKRAKRVRA